jgi:hypothetical protein
VARRTRRSDHPVHEPIERLEVKGKRYLRCPRVKTSHFGPNLFEQEGNQGRSESDLSIRVRTQNISNLDVLPRSVLGSTPVKSDPIGLF